MHPDLLILCATDHEMAPFLAQFPKDHSRTTRTGVRILEGQIEKASYQLVLTGPGVFNTGHALTVLLEKEKPVMILQTGIAGVFNGTGLGIGDVAVADQEQYVHTGVGDAGVEKKPLPFDLVRGMSSTRQGGYEIDKSLSQSCFECLVQEFSNGDVKVGKANIITVSTITATSGYANDIFKVCNPVMEAMEGAAAAHIAALYKIPFVEVRAASNKVGQRDKSKWDIPQAAGRIPGICRAVSRVEVPLTHKAWLNDPIK